MHREKKMEAAEAAARKIINTHGYINVNGGNGGNGAQGVGE
jgi:hypothetical protein